MPAKPSKKRTSSSPRSMPPRRAATAGRRAIGRTESTHPSAAELRARLQLTRPVFARLLGVSERTVADWEHATAPKSGAERAIKELRSVIEACERVMKPTFVGPWLVTAHGSLDGFKPIELIERGETERVLRALFFVEAGIPL